MTKTPRKPLISLCMIVKNEADSLARCLKSVRGVADEIVVVDTGSTDSTVSIARSFGARIVPFPWNGDFAAARNAGLAVARGAWILVLDADEELEPGSTGELLLCAEHKEYEAFFVRIHNHKGADRASQTLTVNPILRMFKSRPQYRFSGIIHEQIAAVIVQETPAAAMHLSTVIVHHYGYADGVVEKKDKISRNLGLLKEQLKLNPGDAFHHFNMAVEYMRLGDYGHALEHIKTSLAEVEPDTSYTHLLYKYEIRCLAVTGELPAALEACEQGIALFPDYPDLHHLKGALLLQVSAFAEAKAALRLALDIGASPPAYHTETGIGTYLTRTLLGQVCQQIGEENEAIACFTMAAQHYPEPWPLVARLLRLFKCAGRELEISGWLSLHLPGILADERGKLTRLLVREGCYAAAADVLGDVLEHTPRTAEAAGLLSRDEQQRAVKRAADESVAEVNPAAVSLLELLHQADAAPASQLKYEDIAALLQHPAVARQGGAVTAAESPASAARPWISLADRVLAAIPASSVYSPAAARARLSLPLPRVAD